MHHVFNSALFSVACASLHPKNDHIWTDSEKILQTEGDYLAPLFFLFMKRDLDSPSYNMRVRTHRPQCILILSLNPITPLSSSGSKMVFLQLVLVLIPICSSSMVSSTAISIFNTSGTVSQEQSQPIIAC